MNRTKTFWRFFLAHQDAQQEAWLEAQARRGWHLVKPGIFGFRFEAGEPREDRYRLDFQTTSTLTGQARLDYLALFRDGGWDCLGQAGNRCYFRARPGALSPEIHTDPESRKARIRRELRVLGAVGGLQVWNTFQVGARMSRASWQEGGSAAHRTLGWLFPPLFVLSALTVLLLGWCSWKLWRALRAEG
ncbi:MAG: hypothetical protein BWY56_02065 [Acidobacteria bacterium ADurb.Bin340]|nr:MAG: hypothetical protein BWY56_02065 [Acidobacteria bacterium ADurb.Bin340]